jgi:hypothetical protein
VKITNKHNLPQTIVNALQRPTYSKGKADISVTELIAPPQLVALKHKHKDDLESDAADMVWSLFGSAVHSILEQGADDDHTSLRSVYTQPSGRGLFPAQSMSNVSVTMALTSSTTRS